MFKDARSEVASPRARLLRWRQRSGQYRPVSFFVGRRIRHHLLAPHHGDLNRGQPLVLVLRRENGLQLTDHGQDVPELELGYPLE